MDDEKTCTPNPALINVQCSHSGISVDIDQCVFGINIVQIGFDQSNQNCQSRNLEVVGLSDSFHVETALDDCGTTHEMTDSNTIGFFNTLSVVSRHSSNSIQLRSNMNIQIGCLFTNTLVTGNNTVIERATGESGTTGLGEFQFFANYFSDATFSHALVADSTDFGFLGSNLYLGVYPYQSLNGVKFYISSCTITDGNHSYAIVDNGCASPLGSIISSFATETMFKLAYTAFKFTGTPHDEETVMDVTCQIRVCIDDCAEPEC